MIEDITLEGLINDLGVWFEQILSMTKSLGNDTRLKILLLLLQKSQTFQSLLNYTTLKKTALSNHINKLISEGLIIRLDHGIYEITSDGKLFIQAIVIAYNNSDHRIEQLKKSEGLK